MDNPETLATLDTQDTGSGLANLRFNLGQIILHRLFHCKFNLIHFRENRKGNNKLTIQGHWQQWANKT